MPGTAVNAGADWSMANATGTEYDVEHIYVPFPAPEKPAICDMEQEISRTL